MTTIKIIPRKTYIKKDNSQSLYLRVTIDRKTKYYSLGLSALENEFDIEKQSFISSADNCNNKNLLIKKHLNKADKIIMEFLYNESQITFSEFEKKFFDRSMTNKKNLSIFDFAKEHIRTKNFKESNKEKYVWAMDKLKRYRKEILLPEIDYNFLNEYECYLRSEIKNKHNTIWKDIAIIKALINEAIKQGVLFENKTINYKFVYKQTDRQFLDLQELKEIEKLLIDKNVSENIKSVCYCFLFACYSGLRFSDIQNLKYCNTDKNFSYIDIINQKTDKRQVFPVTAPGKKILNLVPKNNQDLDPGKRIFKTYSNQNTNEYLKIIAERAGISKNISFHTARHTFATNSLTLGCPIDTVSMLLNHSDLRTTKIYAKIVESKLNKDIHVWDNIG